MLYASLPANAATINEFTVPTASSGLGAITAGPDGNLWFAEVNANKIGRITTTGVITEYTIPTADSWPLGITTGPDGNLWFTEWFGNKIGRITTAGVITEFTVLTASSAPGAITVGPDGNLWFTEPKANTIGQVVLNAGTIPIPSGQQAFLIGSPMITPIVKTDPAQAVPIGIGPVAVSGRILDIIIGLGQFSAPVDVYGAFTTNSATVNILNPDWKSFQTFTISEISQALSTGVVPAGLAPWMSNTLGNIYVALFKNIPISRLPSGIYTLYLVVTPTGSIRTYYIWKTTFIRSPFQR